MLVEGPFGEGTIEELELGDGAVATSGIGRRAWRNPDGTVGHHLLDPGSGLPAFTGLVQVTALAPTARLAEVLAKTRAPLRAPGRREPELPFGGLLVEDDGSVQRLEPRVEHRRRAGGAGGMIAEHHLFWITSRAAGTAALISASVAVAVGLLISRPGVDRLPLRAAHETLSLATLGLIAIHGALPSR